MPKAKLLLVEDHIVVRQGLKALLADEPDIEVIGEANNGRECLQLIPQLQPNIVLMDISMPRLNGIETTCRLRQEYPAIKVVALSMHAHEEYVFQVLQAGASGYVLKQADSSEMIQAIHKALLGETYLGSTICPRALEEYMRRAKNRDQRGLLTPREREVLQLLAEGLTNHEIANQLVISVKTVETHRTNMMRKLNMKSKTDLIKYAFSKGWATVEI